MAGGSGQDPGPGLDLGDEDDVRAPIPQRQETLVQPGFEGYELNNRARNSRARVRSVFDGFRNFEAETLRREREEETSVIVEPPGYNRDGYFSCHFGASAKCNLSTTLVQYNIY